MKLAFVEAPYSRFVRTSLSFNEIEEMKTVDTAAARSRDYLTGHAQAIDAAHVHSEARSSAIARVKASPGSIDPVLREEFGNGDEFYARAGEPIRFSRRRNARPNPQFLEWRGDVVFKAS